MPNAKVAKILCAAAASGAILLAQPEQNVQEQNLEQHGKDLFMRRCSGCHALDLTKEGPPLRDVFGRTAGSVPGFAYSETLKRIGIRWDQASLDRWLSDPNAMAPDTDMAFRLADHEERKAVVAYLRSLAKSEP
jgi:cytochrome c